MKSTFAVIGYGGQGAWHCDQLLASDVAVLKGIYDIDSRRCRAAAERGIRVYASLEELLGEEDIASVVIAVPNDAHLPLVTRALKAGKNVICEKPAALSVAEFDEMTAAAAESGRLFTVHQNRRWDVDFLAIRDLCRSGEIGEMIRLESRVHGSRGIPSDWRSTQVHGGGMLYDWGVHLIDQVLQLFREKVLGVYCHMTHITNTEVDDGFGLTLYFEQNKTAYIEVGTYHFIPLPRFYLQCEQGSAVIEDWRKPGRAARLKRWNEREILPVQTAAGITKTMAPRDDLTLEEYELPRPKSDVHDFYRNFCAALRGEAVLTVTRDQVRRVLSVMEAAFDSAKKQQVITVNI